MLAYNILVESKASSVKDCKTNFQIIDEKSCAQNCTIYAAMLGFE